MSKRLVVAALVVVTLAGLGLWGFVLRTDQGGAAGAAATKSDRGGMRTAGAGAGPSREAAAQAQGLSSKEIQAIRDGLGKAAGAARHPGCHGRSPVAEGGGRSRAAVVRESRPELRAARQARRRGAGLCMRAPDPPAQVSGWPPAIHQAKGPPRLQPGGGSGDRGLRPEVVGGSGAG